MCGRFTMLTFDEVRQIVAETEAFTARNTDSDWPARPATKGAAIAASPSDVFPGMAAPLIATTAECIQSVMMTWGFPLPSSGKTAYNTRIETAAESPLWHDAFANRRCIVPTRAFYEPHSSERGIDPATGRSVKQTYRFALPNGPLLMAGIWQENRFSIVTTTPDAIVAPIHDRMPLVLSPAGARAWLQGDLGTEDDPALRPDNVLHTEPLYPAAPAQGQLSLFE